MNIAEFANVTKAEVDDFVAKWMANHFRGDERLNKDTTYRAAFPLDMPEGEWFDQFISALSTGGKE